MDNRLKETYKSQIKYQNNYILTLQTDIKKLKDTLTNVHITNKLLWGALAVMSLLLMAVWLHG